MTSHYPPPRPTYTGYTHSGEAWVTGTWTGRRGHYEDLYLYGTLEPVADEDCERAMEDLERERRGEDRW